MCETSGDNAFGFHHDFVTAAGNPFYYAVIPALGDLCLRNSCSNDRTCSLHLSQSQEARRTQVASHELIEMCTDPKYKAGWWGSSSDETGDICNGQSASIIVGTNTWNVQRQYSKYEDINTNGGTICVVTAPTPLPRLIPGPSLPLSFASLWHLWQTEPNGDWSGWEDLAFYRCLPEDVSGDPAAASAADGRIEIFRESGGHLWHLWQTAPNGDWSAWEDLGTYRVMPVNVVGRPGVASAADGRIEIFPCGSDTHVWHLWQTTPNGDWSDWEDLSAYRPLPSGLLAVAGNPAAGSAADGRIESFVRGRDDHVWHLWQTPPNGDWSNWEDLSAYRPLPSGLLAVAGNPAAGSAADGRIEIFVRGSDDHVWHLWQTTPNGDWSNWEALSAYRPLPSGLLAVAGNPAAGSAADGRIEIFVRGSDDHVWHLWQTTPKGDASNSEHFTATRPLRCGLLAVAGNPAAGSAADGRIEIFVRGSDDHVWHLWQTTPNGDWSDWEDLSAYRPLPSGLLAVAGNPAAGSAADGRIESFVRGRDDHVWHLWQTTPNGDWSDWEDLSAYRPLP